MKALVQRLKSAKVDENVHRIYESSSMPKIDSKNSRPKAGDYHNLEKDLVLDVANIYWVLLASQGPFPNTAMEVNLIKKAWKLMNEESGLKGRALTPCIITIVSWVFLLQIYHVKGTFI